MTSCAWPRGDDEEPGTRGGVDALVDVADVPDDVVPVGIPEPDNESTGAGAGGLPAAAGRTSDEHRLSR
jgi:hypothetical protein